MIENQLQSNMNILLGINSTDGIVLINSNINCSGYNKIGVFFEGVSGGDGKGGELKIVSKPSSSISISHS